MVVEKEKNIPLDGKHQRPVMTDIFYTPNKEKKPVIIFCHGYKGFKDWGVWNLMARSFAMKGFFFVKFNFSHNGGTLEEPVDFPDLEAFGQNNYIKELDDMETVLDWISSPGLEYTDLINASDITLIGHSRGGGSAIIKAAEDNRVKRLVTLAAVSDFAARFPSGDQLRVWKEKGIAYIENSRTKQQMPHLYQFYTNFKENEERLTISRAARKLDIPFLIIHGSNDPTVNLENAVDLKRWNPAADLFVIEGSDHVFEASHPWEKKSLPNAFEEIVEKTTLFVKEKTT